MVAGANTSMSALRMFCAQGSIPCSTPLVSATTMTSIADTCKNAIASCAVMLSSPTMIPMSTSVTAIHSCMGKNPRIIASITPTRNAQLPIALPVLCFFILLVLFVSCFKCVGVVLVAWFQRVYMC